MRITCSVCGQEYEVSNPYEEESLCPDCVYEFLYDSDSSFHSVDDDNFTDYED